MPRGRQGQICLHAGVYPILPTKWSAWDAKMHRNDAYFSHSIMFTYVALHAARQAGHYAANVAARLVPDDAAQILTQGCHAATAKLVVYKPSAPK